jgi:glucose-6-phosphate 1-dehydrogenase
MVEFDMDPCLFVVFGATGDLMRRKLLPALYQITRQQKLGDRVKILGVSRSNMDDRGFRSMARTALATSKLDTDESLGRWCEQHVHYYPLRTWETEQFQALGEIIRDLERRHELPGNRVFYLALPPEVFPSAIQGLGGAAGNRSRGWTRLVVEKPFGRDLMSARQLNAIARQYFDEAQTYRIDHYLGKETVQNILVFRFANPIFETMWNRDRVESVQITVAEDLGIEQRAGYYEQTGALRDMVQNHLTQIVTLMAMEAPSSFHPEAIRDEKVKVLHSIAPISPSAAVFGQYTEGNVNGHKVPGYLHEPGVATDSQVETYVGLKLAIANWRWQGVPFYLRTGKRLPRRTTKVVVTFRCAPVSIFKPFDRCDLHCNVLIITIQPDEGFDLHFEVKMPGQPIQFQTQSLRFRYSEVFAPLPDAYQTLLLDVLRGDPTLFVRGDWVEASWRLYDDLLQKQLKPYPYPAGTWGPSPQNLFSHQTDWLPI